MSTPLAASSRKVLFDIQVHTDQLSVVRRDQPLSKGHIQVGHLDLTASAEGFAAQAGAGLGAEPELSLPIFLLLHAFGVSANAWDVTV